MRRFALLVFVACMPQGSSNTTPPPSPPPPAASGGQCPAADGVYVASFLSQDAVKGRSGWVLPLHAMAIEPGASTKMPDYAILDATAATVSGVPAAPTGTLWLVTPGVAPCRASLGRYYAAKLPGPPASLAYGVELEGCAAPSDPQDSGGIAMVTDLPPDDCKLDAPRPVALRLGDEDGQKQWHRPVRQTPIPPALTAVLPQRTCLPPGCEQLWAIGEVDFAGRPVAWTGAINWLTIDNAAPSAQCTWKTERDSGTWIVGPDAKPGKLTEGQTPGHTLALSAVLSDNGGPRVALVEGPGEYATYSLATGVAKLARSVTWMLVPNDAWEQGDHLGPTCERPTAPPAPLPKDAKPVSPY
jgi:hypothetical protein